MQEKEEIIEVTQDLVEFKTVKGNDEEFEKAFEYVKNYFENQGLELFEHEENDHRTIVIATDENPDLMLHGHVDVVGAEDSMFQPRTEEGKLYGRGSADMKLGLACLMKLMKEIDHERSVGLMIVSDEEIGGFDGAGNIMENDVYTPEFAVSAEPESSGSWTITVEQKGVVRAIASSTGKNAHGSKPWKGENAAEMLFEKFQELKKNFEGSESTWSSTVNLGSFESGETFNVVPDRAEARLDIRWTKDYPPEEIKKDAESIEGLEYEELTVDPMLYTEKDDEMVETLKSIVNETMKEKVSIGRWEAASDMRHFSDRGIPSVVFGPKGHNIHEDEEYADLSSVEKYYQTMERFAGEF
ncbi:MAG: M20/M25/M40 family metallo-hydrolase [Nanohaloarchaea archaeon]|nr:M20/M25/M40 family metallo-hydrolase [Candidatus Nanohaloarchaea archaeon]